MVRRLLICHRDVQLLLSLSKWETGAPNRLESSTEIIFAAGEGCQLTPLPRSFEFRADPFFRRFHFAGSQSVFLQRVIRRDHFHRTQRCQRSPKVHHLWSLQSAPPFWDKTSP